MLTGASLMASEKETPQVPDKCEEFFSSSFLSNFLCVCVLFCVFAVRDRVRTKMERDILVDVRHPFIVHLEYGEFFQSFILNLNVSAGVLILSLVGWSCDLQALDQLECIFVPLIVDLGDVGSEYCL